MRRMVRHNIYIVLSGAGSRCIGLGCQDNNQSIYSITYTDETINNPTKPRACPPPPLRHVCGESWTSR